MINLKIIVFMVLMAFCMASCKKEQNAGKPDSAGQKISPKNYHAADSTVTNISPDSTQAEPSAITKP